MPDQETSPAGAYEAPAAEVLGSVVELTADKPGPGSEVLGSGSDPTGPSGFIQP